MQDIGTREAPFGVTEQDVGKDKFELYSLLWEGLDDMRAGRERPIDEVFADIRRNLDLEE